MSRFSNFALAGICVASLWIVVAATAQSNSVPDAERSARLYMTAFLAGDLKTAADLTDPRTLDRIRESFLADLMQVSDPVAERAILANLGIARTTVELSHVDAKTLYVALTESNHRRNPQLFETMKMTRVEVLSSAPSPNGGVTVHLRIIAPAGAATSSQESALLMRQVLGEWKVVGVAP